MHLISRLIKYRSF